MRDISFTPPPTVKKFMNSNAKYRAIMGPVGSGKSVGMCFEVVRRACEQAPGPDGKRRSRWLVVRETARQLQDTTIKTWLDWFAPGVCGDWFKTIKTFVLKIGDVEAEVIFRGLDDPDDLSNLLSLEVTGCWINECRDIPKEIVDGISKRIDRYPSRRDGGPTWAGIFADTNPPTIDTYWYYVFEHLDPNDGVTPWANGWEIYKQPSGRSPLAENRENLAEEYYDTTGRDPDYVRVYVDGEYGHSLAGKPVFRYFNADYHVAKTELRPIVSALHPLIIGMDLGLTPAAVVGQLDPRGRALVLAEATGFDMGVQRFCATLLRPLLAQRFPGHPIMVVCDPAGVQRAQSDEKSAVDIIKAMGFKVIPAKTNAITARINAVDDYLLRQVDGDAALLIDPRCSALKAAMMGGYRYRLKKQSGEFEESPEKNKHSHIADALQYFALHTNASYGGRVSTLRRVETARIGGWI